VFIFVKIVKTWEKQEIFSSLYRAGSACATCKGCTYSAAAAIKHKKPPAGLAAGGEENNGKPI